MSGGRACRCDERREPLVSTSNRAPRLWRVLDRYCNHSAFNGYHETPSDWSALLCLRCGTIWRTKAAYVDRLPDATEDERMNWPRSGEIKRPGVATHAEMMIALGRTPYNYGLEGGR